MEQFFPKDAIIKTGNPVRASIAQANIGAAEAKRFFELNEQQKTLLIVGGSLGAKAINEAIAANLELLTSAGLQIIWQTGEPFYQEAVKAAADYPQVKVHAFIRQMEQAYAAADMVISRAGALAIAELCIVAKPVIFVPYPFAAEDHQTSNALSLTRKDAALMIKNDEAQLQLTGTLLQLLSNEALQQQMHRNLEKEAIKDADERIARIVIDIVNQKN
ncbi:UDP-N-acetylglucosamine--N-acetylmuramyl-(pentapeptide) pyrophosphoryl-undecaprenol N-acetylglucosamine transferase [compost metagenome]